MHHAGRHRLQPLLGEPDGIASRRVAEVDRRAITSVCSRDAWRLLPSKHLPGGTLTACRAALRYAAWYRLLKAVVGFTTPIFWGVGLLGGEQQSVHDLIARAVWGGGG